MKKLILFPFIALLLITLISCEKDQFEPVTSLSGEEEMVTTRANATVPFKAEIYNIIDLTQVVVDSNGTMHDIVNGTGNVTHLGKCTFFAVSTVYFAFADPPVDPPFVQDATIIFTAANGATLVGELVGTTSPGIFPVFFVGNGTYEITSGTGRFAGVTGSGTYSYVASIDPDTGVLSAENVYIGTLTNP